MITFTKTDNSVEVDFGTELHYITTETSVTGKVGGDTVLLSNVMQGGNSRHYWNLKTTDINGRPSDDAAQVATWLRDNFFSQLVAPTGGGGGGGDASAANQLTMIQELQDIEADVEAGNTLLTALSDKTASSQVTEEHDTVNFVYLTTGPNIGEIDYIAYLLGITEVARLTFSYDADSNVTSIVKT